MRRRVSARVVVWGVERGVGTTTRTPTESNLFQSHYFSLPRMIILRVCQNVAVPVLLIYSVNPVYSRATPVEPP